MEEQICIRCGCNMLKNCEYNYENKLTPEDENYKAQSGQTDKDTNEFVCSDCFTDEEHYDMYITAHYLIYGHEPYNCDEDGACCCESK